MYVRGSDQAVEYKREVNSFFRGIVIDNDDPNEQLRVKVFVPQLVNHDFFQDKGLPDTLQFGAPQKETALDGALLEKLRPLIPWAEQASPLMGEVGASHWNAPSNQQWYQTNVGNPPKNTGAKPKWEKGSAPVQGRVNIANSSKQPDGTSSGDAFTKPEKTGMPYPNPTGNAGAPKNSGVGVSGLYGRPQVGSMVWVFHEHGDLQFPVYFAAVPNYKDVLKVGGGGPFENKYEDTPPDTDVYTPDDAVEDTPMSPIRTDGSFNKEDLPPNLRPLADDYIKYGQQYGVDPRFLAAISILETNSGRSKAFIQGNNAMGISNRTGVNYYRNDPAARSRTIEQMARSMARSDGYYRNATTPNQVGPIYAPSGADNDVYGTNSGWARNVSNIMRRQFGVENAGNLQVITRT